MAMTIAAEELIGRNASRAFLHALSAQFGPCRTSPLPGRTYYVFSRGLEIAVDPESDLVEMVVVYPSAEIDLPKNVDLGQHRHQLRAALGPPDASMDEEDEHFDVWGFGRSHLWITYDASGYPRHATIKPSSLATSSL